MKGDSSREIEATVDTGAAYTTLPARFLCELGIEPITQRRFPVADGRMVNMDIGRAWVTIDGASEVTIVAFGEDDSPPLLGAYTMEGLGLAVDPTSGRLVPANLIMYLIGAYHQATNAPRVNCSPEVLERSAGVHPAGPELFRIKYLRCRTPLLRFGSWRLWVEEA